MKNRTQDVTMRLQQQIRDELGARKLGAKDLAERMGLLPVGAEVILARKDWTLETALQVAEAVGLDVDFTVSRGT